MSANGNAPAGTADYMYSGVIENREAEAIQAAEDSARQGGIANPIVRDILPDVDLNSTGDTDFTGSEVAFVQTPSSDDPGDVTAYEIDSDTGKMDDRVMAIYGFEVVSGGEFVDVIRFRGSDGQVFERAHVQGLDSTGDQPIDRQMVLRSPVLFEAQDNGEIEFEIPSYTASSDDPVEIKLLGVTAEKLGRTLGTRQ